MADFTNCEFLSIQDYKPKTIPHRPYGQGFLLQVSTFVLAIISVVLNFTNMNQVHHRSIDGSPDSWSFNGGQCSSTELAYWILLNKIEKPWNFRDIERNQNALQCLLEGTLRTFNILLDKYSTGVYSIIFNINKLTSNISLDIKANIIL